MNISRTWNAGWCGIDADCVCAPACTRKKKKKILHIQEEENSTWQQGPRSGEGKFQMPVNDLRFLFFVLNGNRVCSKPNGVSGCWGKVRSHTAKVVAQRTDEPVDDVILMSRPCWQIDQCCTAYWKHTQLFLAHLHFFGHAFSPSPSRSVAFKDNLEIKCCTSGLDSWSGTDTGNLGLEAERWDACCRTPPGKIIESSVGGANLLFRSCYIHNKTTLCKRSPKNSNEYTVCFTFPQVQSQRRGLTKRTSDTVSRGRVSPRQERTGWGERAEDGLWPASGGSPQLADY